MQHEQKGYHELILRRFKKLNLRVEKCSIAKSLCKRRVKIIQRRESRCEEKVLIIKQTL